MNSVLATAYTIRKKTKLCEMVHNTAENATRSITDPRATIEKYRDRWVKLLMSSAMRWSGLSIPLNIKPVVRRAG